MNRVLLLIKGLGRGGAEQLLANAIPYHDETRFEYEVAYLLPWKDALAGEIEAAGVPVTCLEGHNGVAWASRLRSLVRDRDIDIVHSHSPVAASVARVVVSGPVRHVYTEHNVWERYRSATRWANAATFGRNAHVFAVSNHVRDSVAYPFVLRRRSLPTIETLYHGIDQRDVARWRSIDGVRAEFDIAADAPIVGTVANFKAHKRLDRLIAAAELVRRRVPDVRFVVVGQGPLEHDVRQLASDRGLAGTMVFTGFRADAQRIAAAFDVFALSSEHEGLSIAVIEALALGRPAVVTDVGGLPEVVRDGREGFVVPSDDPAALADRLVTLIDDDVMRARMGQAGAIRAKDFDIRSAVRRMEQVYKEVSS
jgi:glycosyltransferase involved in cell wall biosynthesis